MSMKEESKCKKDGRCREQNLRRRSEDNSRQELIQANKMQKEHNSSM